MKTYRQIHRYCRQIRGWLPCPAKEKNAILAQIKINIADYQNQNPDADFAAIAAHFGTPQSIASSYVDLMDTGELLRKLRRRGDTGTVLLSPAL